MPYYNYHNRLKQLLNTEQYVCIPEDGEPFIYRFIFPKIMKSYPIREYRLEEYKEWIKE